MSENENLDLNKYDIFYICMLTFCLIVVLLDIVGFFKFRAYNNLSSAMLIVLDISIFLWTGFVFAICIWKDKTFRSHFIAILDLSNFISSYLIGIVVVSIYFQWAQVYKVIADPNNATETFAQNRAAKKQLVFIIYFTLVLAGSLSFTMMADQAGQNNKTFESTKVAFALINTITRVLIICAYVVLFYKFHQLIKKE